jgi:hypothetical protein
MASQTQTAPAYTDPSSPSVFHRHNLHQSSQKKPWQARRRSSFKSNKSNKSRGPEPEEERLSRETSRRTTQSTKRTPKWWKIRFFRGMIGDVKRRAPYYRSDWTDAWDYRVVPATVYMYFAKYEITYIPFSTLPEIPLPKLLSTSLQLILPTI